MPQRFIVTLLAACVIGVPTAFHAQATTFTPPTVERIAPDLELSRIIAAVVGSDGRACLLDDLELRLHCLRADGSLLWSFGHKGEGPGEWTTIYRLGIAPDHVVTVIGFGMQVHQIGADGKFLRQGRLPLVLGEFGSVLPLTRDTFVVAGGVAGRGGNHSAAIHLFAFQGDSIVLLRSFGTVPEIADRSQQSSAPVGTVTLTARRTLLHARIIPNTVAEYDLSGKLLRQVTSPIVPFDPSKGTKITKTPGRAIYQTVKPPVGSNRIGSAREFRPGSWWVFRTTVGVGQFFDVVDPATNRWLPPKPLPAWPASLAVVGLDSRGGYFLGYTTCDDEPCLVRFRSAPYFGSPRP